MSGSKKVVLLSTSASELKGHKTGLWIEELATPFYLFSAAGFEVTIASIAGGEPPVDAGSKSGDFYTEDCKKFDNDETAQKLFKDSVKFDTIAGSITDYDCIYLAGGHGTCVDFVENKVLDKALSDMYAAGKVVAADCHGPVGLCGAKKSNGEPLVKGLTVSGFTDDEEKAVGLTGIVPFLLETKLKELGGKYVKKDNWAVCVSCDSSGTGTLITGQNPGSSKACAAAVVTALK
eukprot:CAMPEP_0197531984 /NCGR_PEP_ID=MMETSP1318-20131121/38073_1 /TAXON_ID=552666 /ORGANISM="Partenskyella glossopodia, Strain RCC365" /LENGTH=233 /DNA_ID=CAMNT_0043088403 /DNA_START=87 /DNA_END=788 /DNA_ORIENTATION=-